MTTPTLTSVFTYSAEVGFLIHLFPSLQGKVELGTGTQTELRVQFPPLALMVTLRTINGHTPCSSGTFNTSSLTEIYVCYEYEDGEYEMDTDYPKNYEVQLPDGSWKSLSQAFQDHDVVPNNFNTHFGFPQDDKCKARGWNP